MAMARRSMIQHPNSGNDVGPLLLSGKLASSESSASEKAEDTGERQSRFPHHLRSSSAHPGALAGFIQAMDDAILDYDSAYDYANTSSFEFQKGDRGGAKPLVAPYLNKAAPSKWDDAEKWLVSQSPGEAPVKAKTKSGPLHGHYGYGGLHLGKRVTGSNQYEWHAHSHAVKNGYQTHIASVLPNEGDTLLLVDGGGHHQNVKLVTTSHPDQNFDLPGEWTKKMDAVKGPGIAPGGGPNFGFIPVPSSSPKGSSFDCHPVADEPVHMKEVSVSHEENYDELLLKPMSRTRKPTSDSLASAAPYATPAPAVRSVSMRDMGTEMTPIASQEPSRTGTPIRATTPTLRSPVSSCPSTPRGGSPTASPAQDSENVSVLDNDGKTFELSEKGMQAEAGRELQVLGAHVGGKVNLVSWASKEEEDADASKSLKNIDLEEVKKNVLETRAASWEEAEQSKYLARFKREEAKILALENHEKAKAEAEMRRIEVKVDKIRSCAHEKLMNKIAAARRRAEERRAAAEAKRFEQASKTAHRADYMRRTGRIPSMFFSCGFCH